MSDYITDNRQIDDRATAALSAEAGLDWDQAQRMTEILRRVGVLRSAIDVRAVRVTEKLDVEPYVELDFENGRKLAGSLCRDIPPVLGWSNPLLSDVGGSNP
ncbi:hypothetical protein ACFXG4_04865 [Nocardia sp. NPDC059246]|uniref:hypothetical protein n=1 Tax=unclassified Nocardia TaxID=2637762 RepID=UPI0036CBD91C